MFNELIYMHCSVQFISFSHGPQQPENGKKMQAINFLKVDIENNKIVFPSGWTLNVQSTAFYFFLVYQDFIRSTGPRLPAITTFTLVIFNPRADV